MSRILKLHYAFRLADRTAPMCNSAERGGSRSERFRTTIYRMNVTCAQCMKAARIEVRP